MVSFSGSRKRSLHSLHVQKDLMPWGSGQGIEAVPVAPACESIQQPSTPCTYMYFCQQEGSRGWDGECI